MNRQMLPAVVGFAVAALVTGIMDATGYSVFSALPLIPFAGFFWYLQKFSRTEVGLTWGAPRDYVPALAYPVLVLGSIGLIAALTGAVDVSETDWRKTLTNVGLMSTTGVVMAMITEEGFFRGWLWASLKRAGKSDTYVLVWTSLAFAAWHIPAISLDTGFNVPANEIPIYLVNATLLGLIWGLLRLVSGSVLVPAVCHAVWNGIDYPLYGFGEKVGALGIEQTHIFGPEVGVVGVLVNLLAAGVLFYKLSWNKK
jgi:membrane protease YdiL (CAAX protease family)